MASVYAKSSIAAFSLYECSELYCGDFFFPFVDHNIVPMLLETLKKDSYKVKKEAAWAVNNIVNGGTEAQVKYVLLFGEILRLSLQDTIHHRTLCSDVIIHDYQPIRSAFFPRVAPHCDVRHRVSTCGTARDPSVLPNVCSLSDNLCDLLMCGAGTW
jgi:hypothetical protein